VSRRFIELAAAIVLILAALTPLMECFDRWDNEALGPDSDTEIHVTAWFVGVGIVLTLAKLLRYIPLLVSSRKHYHHVLPRWQGVRQWTDNNPESTESPSLIPLRI
jgi:hypothetical protein